MSRMCRPCLDSANVGLFAPAVEQQERERPQLYGGKPRSCCACNEIRPVWRATSSEAERAQKRGERRPTT